MGEWTTTTYGAGQSKDEDFIIDKEPVPNFLRKTAQLLQSRSAIASKAICIPYSQVTLNACIAQKGFCQKESTRLFKTPMTILDWKPNLAADALVFERGMPQRCKPQKIPALHPDKLCICVFGELYALR